MVLAIAKGESFFITNYPDIILLRNLKSGYIVRTYGKALFIE